MRRVQNSAVAYIVASIVALAGIMIAAPSPASADPGKIPDGPVNFYIMGGNLSFGGQLPGTLPINQNLPHPDVPPECSDGVDNELGAFHAFYTPASPTPIIAPQVGATDGRIDFGTATTQENGPLSVYSALPSPNYSFVNKNTGCANATDNVELFDREYIVQDPVYLPNPTIPNGQDRRCIDNQPFGGPVTANAEGPGCGTNPGTGDACLATNVSNTCQTSWASTVFGNGSTGNGQEKVRQAATGGTVSGTGVTVPQANIKFARGYQGQGQCQTIGTITACIDLYVEFAISPTTGITGVTNPDGSGSVSTSFNLVVKLSMTYDSVDVLGAVPNAAICPSINPVNLNLTTESSGSLTGSRYDDFRQNFKVVQDPFTVSAFATSQGTFGGSAANLCSELNKQLFGADDPTATATNGKASLVISGQDSSNTPTSSAAGTGMPWSVTNPAAINGANWNPVAAVRTAVAGGAYSAPATTNTNVPANEGDLVQLDSSVSYDPAMRPFTTNTFARTGGTAPPPPATTGVTDNSINFVAQDAPLAGNTHVFAKNITSDLGPSNQTQSDVRTTTIQVNNVAPTANAGPSKTVSGGLQQSLTGTSVDPGDLDVAGQRGYCWTQTAGTSVGLPACTGSPANNRPSDGTTGRFLPLNFTPANADDDKTFQLVVCDKDGGCSAPVTTDYFVKAQSANTISGTVLEGFSPIDAATVTLYNSGGFVASTSSNPSGQYSFGSLAPGSDYFVSASKSGYSTVYYDGTQNASAAKRLTVNGSTGRADIDVQLNLSGDLGSLTGNLVDTTAGAVTGMGVRLYDSQGFVATTTTDGSGAYTFTNLTPKSGYKLRFNCSVGCGAPQAFLDQWHRSSPPTALFGSQSDQVTVPTGFLTNVGTDTMIRNAGPDEQHTISGTVTGGGPALDRVQVRVYDFSNGTWLNSVLTNAGGTYSLSLPPGTYKVWFWTKNTALVPAPPLATQARTSQWYDGPGTFINGEQSDGSGKLVTVPVNANAGGSTVISPALP